MMMNENGSVRNFCHTSKQTEVLTLNHLHHFPIQPSTSISTASLPPLPAPYWLHPPYVDCLVSSSLLSGASLMFSYLSQTKRVLELLAGGEQPEPLTKESQAHLLSGG